MISQTVPVFPRDLKVSFWKIEYICGMTLLPLPTAYPLAAGFISSRNDDEKLQHVYIYMFLAGFQRLKLTPAHTFHSRNQ